VVFADEMLGPVILKLAFLWRVKVWGHYQDSLPDSLVCLLHINVGYLPSLSSCWNDLAVFHLGQDSVLDHLDDVKVVLSPVFIDVVTLKCSREYFGEGIIHG